MQRGRQQDDRVTLALYGAVIDELSVAGFTKITIATIAAGAHTSKQAIYRRFKSKETLIAAALNYSLQQARPAPPLRRSAAEDLRLLLADILHSFHGTPLGGAFRSVLPYRQEPEFIQLFQDFEDAIRLTLRQIFLATPFEADMETRIDLLLGFIYFRGLLNDDFLKAEEVERIIYLVLGLVAPKDTIGH